MGVRLNKVLTELNIGLQEAVDYLKIHKELGDIKDDATPNTKIWDNQYEALVNHFKRSIRLNKVLSELNIGFQTAVDFLKVHKELGDVKDDITPCTKISVEQYNALTNEYGDETNSKTQADLFLFQKSKDKPLQDVEVLGRINLDSIGKPSEDGKTGQSFTPLGKIDLDSIHHLSDDSDKNERNTKAENRTTTTHQTIVRANEASNNNRDFSNSGKKYDVFVSYSRLDSNRVQSIVGEIEKKGYRVWIDKKGIDSGDEFKTTIVKAIRNSEVFLFFSSRGANESTWTMKEVNTAVHFKKVIIPVKLDNTEYDDFILLELVGLDYVDFTDSTQYSYGISKLTKALQKKISHSTGNERK